MGYAIAAATIFFIHGSYSHRFLQTKTQVDMLLNKKNSINNGFNNRYTYFVSLYHN